MKKPFHWKIVIILVGMLLFGSTYLGYVFQYERLVITEHNQLSTRLNDKAQILQNELLEWESDLRILQTIPPIQGIIRAARNDGIDPFDQSSLEDWRKRLESIFSGYIKSHDSAYQMRYISATDGNEIVRVDKATSGIKIVSKDQLQYKGDRDYFHHITKENFSGIYVSDITLNREFSVIQSPHVPIIRLAIRVYAETSELFGFIIINLDASNIVNKLDLPTGGDTLFYITNDNNQFIYRSDSVKAFDFEFGQGSTLADVFPGVNLAGGSADTDNWLIEQTTVPLMKGLRSLTFTAAKSSDDLVAQANLYAFYSFLATLLVSVLCLTLFASYRRNVRSQAQLAIERAQHSAIIDGSQDAIIGVTLDGRIKSWNQSAYRLFGYTKDEALGTRMNSLFKESDIHDEVLKVLEGGGIKPFETQRMAKDGQMIDVSISASPIKDENGTIIGLSKIIRDIREQKKFARQLEAFNYSLEQQIRERTFELKKTYALQTAILSNSAHSVVATDARGIITLFNPAAEKLLGYTSEEILGNVTPALFHLSAEMEERAAELSLELGREVQPNLDVFAAMASNSLNNVSEWTYVAKSGQKIPVFLSISELYDVDGNIFGYLGIASDISELSKNRSQLETLKNQLSIASDIADIGIWSWNTATQEITWNARMYKLYDMEDGDDIDFDLWESMVAEEDRVKSTEHFVQLAQGVNDSSIIFNVITANGTHKVIHAAATIEYDEHTQVASLVGINKDISDQVRYEEALKAAKEAADLSSKIKSEFVANMSHEIRTPMNAIIGLLELLRYTPLDEEQLRYVNKSGRAAQSLLHILNDILDFSKVEAGKLEMDPHPFRLMDLKENLTTVLTSTIDNKDLELEIEIDPQLPSFITLDSYRLQQIVINLAGNAIKFTAQGKVKVLFSYGRENQSDMLLIEVSDTGIGISQDKQKIIFEAFRQAETSTVREYGGTGLGLFITTSLVAMMEGELSLSSQVGVGTTFKVRVPFYDANDHQASVPALQKTDESMGGNVSSSIDVPLNGDKTQRLNSVKILLVEDNAVNQLVAKKILELEGAEIHLAENGQEAVDSVRSHGKTYDVVLMDIQMPVLDGYEATKMIRQLDESSDIPIIAMTANAMTSDQQDAIDAGMDDYVSKPFNTDVLIETIQRCASLRSDMALERELVKPDLGSKIPSVLNVSEALTRLSNDEHIYGLALSSYLSDSNHLIAQLPRDLDASNADGVLSTLHTLRGASATIGAEQLVNDIQAVEADIRSLNYTNYKQAFESVTSLHEEACLAVNQYLEDAKDRAPVIELAEQGGVTAGDIIALNELLAQSNMKAVDAFNELMQRTDNPYSDILTAIQNAVEQLEFDIAHDQLTAYLGASN